ncbi:hypothetical protein Dsin_030454 [Dipteronia sinensis]|uniref:DUF1985 domain-containing protein n=1 Tax=Dipteronia sinensis TaxID=43782 RepID=A0AAE0DR46_9ROSI|nr:hypothetical protein Dsin_030454 [Dipteronia sinensis]
MAKSTTFPTTNDLVAGFDLCKKRDGEFDGHVKNSPGRLCELDHEGPNDEMRFMLGTNSVQISRVEFCLITGLKFGAIPDTALYEDVPNSIYQRYFGGRDAVTFTKHQARIEQGQWQQQFDAVELCLLLMVNCVLTGLKERYCIPIWQLCLVDDIDAFLWGLHV